MTFESIAEVQIKDDNCGDNDRNKYEIAEEEIQVVPETAYEKKEKHIHMNEIPIGIDDLDKGYNKRGVLKRGQKYKKKNHRIGSASTPSNPMGFGAIPTESRMQQQQQKRILKEEDSDIISGSESEDESMKETVRGKSNRNCWISIFVASMSSLMFGISQGNFGYVQGFEDFENHWCLGRYGDNSTCHGDNALSNHAWNYDFIMWAVALPSIGAAIGAITVGPPVTENFGRRAGISLGSLITAIGASLSVVVAKTPAVFFTSRFIQGFGIGLATYSQVMYTAELAPPGRRGLAVGLFQLFTVIGSFISVLLTLYIKNWRVGLILPAFPAIVLTFATWACVKSPRFVAKKKGIKEACVSLQKIRNGSIKEELEEIDDALKEGKIFGASSLKSWSPDSCDWSYIFANNRVLHRIMIASGLQLAQQLTGVNIFLSYADSLYGELKITDPVEFNCMFTGIQVAGILVCLILVDRKNWCCGRKYQLLISSMFITPTMFLSGFVLVAVNWPGQLPTVMIMTYGFGFQVGWGAIAWIYVSEIFKLYTREKAMAVAVFSQYIFNFVVVIIGPFMVDGIGVGGAFLIFSLLSFISIGFVAYFVKETKRVSFERVPMIFEYRVPTYPFFD